MTEPADAGQGARREGEDPAGGASTPEAAGPRRWPRHTRILVGLVVGAALGLVAHAVTSVAVPRDVVALEAGDAVVGLELHARGGAVSLAEVSARVESGPAPAPPPGLPAALGPGGAIRFHVTAPVRVTSVELGYAPEGRRHPVVVEVWGLPGAQGAQWRKLGESGDPPAVAAVVWLDRGPAVLAGKAFLRLIFMIVVPLVVSSLVLGVLGLGDARRLGRVGLRTLGCTLLTSGAAVAIGVTLVSVVQPGAGVGDEARDALLAGARPDAERHVASARQAKPWVDALLSLLPDNPLAAAVNALSGDMIALMVFSVIFGVAYGQVRGPDTEGLASVLTAVQRASMRVVDWAMALAPYGVGALVFSLTARTGVDVVGRLGAYVAVVVGGLTLQLVVVYGLMLALLARVSPRAWFRRCREVALTAFSTASSNATLPTTLRTAEEALGVAPRVGTFVLTVGATGNQNGTALFEGVTVLFLAQVFGVPLTLDQQVVVVLMSVLAGVGTAGVPGGSLPLIVIVLPSVGVPPEGIGIVLGVDRFLDMCRTVVNVVGDLVIATVVARAEGELAFEAAGARSP